MEFDKDLFTSPFMERFGKGVNIDKTEGNKVHIVHETDISSEVFAWIFSLGTGAKLLSPSMLHKE